MDVKSTSDHGARLAGIDPDRQAAAIVNAEAKRKRGQRVWCVPFARTASGIDISGNANTWWAGAQGKYPRGHAPHAGAVMAFASSGAMPMGHVAVVSRVLAPRTITITHANWSRNRVSLDMVAHDVSEKNDWSRVRVESSPGVSGRVNPVSGFIYPRTAGGN